jgi:hypothetical protein
MLTITFIAILVAVLVCVAIIVWGMRLVERRQAQGVAEQEIHIEGLKKFKGGVGAGMIFLGIAGFLCALSLYKPALEDENKRLATENQSIQKKLDKANEDLDKKQRDLNNTQDQLDNKKG